MLDVPNLGGPTWSVYIQNKGNSLFPPLFTRSSPLPLFPDQPHLPYYKRVVFRFHRLH